MFHAMRRLVMALTFVLLAAGQIVRADPVLEFSPGSGNVANFTGGDTSGGWSFTTNQAITVVALDAFNPNSGNDVRLYDGNGTVLASAIVLPTDPTEGSPIPFYTHAIAPVTLAAGQTYYIAEDFPANINGFWIKTDSPMTDPAITYGAAVFAAAGLGQDPTTDAFHGNLNPGYFGPNFDIGGTTSAAPEPGTMVIVMVALAVTGAYSGLRKRFWIEKGPR
jgi:hypothetical protein